MKLQKNIKYSHKHLSEYLSNESDGTIFLQPTNKEEISSIFFLNSNKAFGLNSMPQRILFLLKIAISEQLADLFSLSFITGVFPSVRKTTVVPFFKKDQN